jgi:Domain of unknown function (DUF4157)
MAAHGVKATRPRTVAPRTPHRAPPIYRMAPTLQAHRAHVRGTLGRHAAQPAPLIQPKLRVGAVDDPAEHEADRLADRVMRLPEPAVQRACCAGCASGGACADQVQRAATPGPVLPHGGRVDSSLVSSLGPGRPLPAAERGFFEPRFGADLSAVRLHSGPQAGTATRAIDARAFTYGSDIAIAPGEFQPGTNVGRRLIAHELTHVVQQGAVPRVDAQPPCSRISADAGVALQRQFKPSRDLEDFARTAIRGLDDDNKKMKFVAVVSAANRSELPAFAAILRAKPHRTYGDYFIFLIAELEQDWGSRRTVTILQWFADAGVDISKLNYSLDPLAAVARFRSLVQRYQAALSSGRVREADRQRVGQAIAEADMALRGIEGPARKPGAQVQQMGGVALAAGALWTTAGILAADDVTVIGVADDVAIPFVIIAAATLSAIALFTGGRKPEILDYGPAKAKVDAALLAIAAAVNVAVNVPRPAPLPPPPQSPTREPQRPAPRPEPAPGPQTGPTVDIAPQPGQPERKRPARRACPKKVRLPSGPIEAKMARSDSGYTLQVPFSMEIDFTNDPRRGCDCSLGEYKQEIMGWAQADLGRGWTDLPMPLTATGQPIDPNDFQEDAESGWPYGRRFMGTSRRTPHRNTDNDRFEPDRATGCLYRGKDRAGFDLQNPPPGARYRFHLWFRGAPVDGIGRGLLLHWPWRTWECFGEMKIPEPPKPTPKPTRSRRSPPAKKG